MHKGKELPAAVSCRLSLQIRGQLSVPAALKLCEKKFSPRRKACEVLFSQAIFSNIFRE